MLLKPPGRRILMSRTSACFGVCAVALPLLLSLIGCANKAAIAKDNAQKITAQDVPPQVMTSVNNRFPGADITSVEKENENGAVIYDFELKQHGRKFETDVKEDGTI